MEIEEHPEPHRDNQDYRRGKQIITKRRKNGAKS
jgi:hypothetical protein